MGALLLGGRIGVEELLCNEYLDGLRNPDGSPGYPCRSARAQQKASAVQSVGGSRVIAKSGTTTTPDDRLRDQLVLGLPLGRGILGVSEVIARVCGLRSVHRLRLVLETANADMADVREAVV